MSTAQLIIVCITILWIVGIRARREPPAESLDPFAGIEIGDRVAAYLADGQVVRGVVVGLDGQLLLREATFISEGTEVKVGSVRVPPDSVLMLQELDGPPPPAVKMLHRDRDRAAG